MEGHKKLYEEALVKEIMINTALYVQDLMQDNTDLSEEDLCMFLEENYSEIIEEALSANDDNDEDIDNWKKE